MTRLNDYVHFSDYVKSGFRMYILPDRINFLKKSGLPYIFLIKKKRNLNMFFVALNVD